MKQDLLKAKLELVVRMLLKYIEIDSTKNHNNRTKDYHFDTNNPLFGLDQNCGTE